MRIYSNIQIVNLRQTTVRLTEYQSDNRMIAWQSTRPNDPIWHVSSRSGEVCCELLYPVTILYFTVRLYSHNLVV